MQSTSKKWLYWFAGILLGVLILLAIMLTLTPTIIKYYYADWLEQQGLHGEIGDIDMQLGSGRIFIKNISIRQNQKEQLAIEKISLQTQIRDIFDNKITIESFEISGLRLFTEQDAKSFSVAGISLSDSTQDKTKDDSQNAAPWIYSIKNLALNNIQSCFKEITPEQKIALDICQSISSLKWTGHAQYQSAVPADKAISAHGNMAVISATTQDMKNNRTIMSFDQLNFDNIEVNSTDDINLGKISLKNITVIREAIKGNKGLHTAQLKKLSLDKLALQKKNNLTIEDISLTSLAGTLRITEKGQFAAYEYIQTLLPEPDKTIGHDNKSPFTVKIQQISVETDDTITIIDNSVQPPVQHKLGKLHVNIKNLDSTDKNNFSLLSFDLNVGDYGSLKLSGKAQLLAEKPTYLLDANINALNLAELSNYSQKLLNHKIKSGQLDAQLKIKVEQGQLDSNATLYLHKFYVQKGDQKAESKEQEKLGMPLSAALSLLRSKEDRIKLELPITGNIKDPEFSLNDAFNTVTVKAIKSTIVNYYISFGLIPVLEKSYDLATALRFNPVNFDANNIELDIEDKQQLDKISQLLNERPEVHLVICGHVTREDRFKLFPMQQEWFLENKKETMPDDEDGTKKEASTPPLPSLSNKQLGELIYLAKQRGEKVKEYLVKAKGIGGDRLILCNPVYDPEDTEPPYVEIKI